jgi:P4 family phage/plasmid primase-like protien
MGNLVQLDDVRKPVFYQGDEVEIAAYVAARLMRDSGQPPIYDLGHVYVYNAERGIYRRVEDCELGWLVQELSGAPIFSGDDDKPPKKMRISNNVVKGALALTLANIRMLTPPNFFAEGPRGIAFRNCFLRADGSIASHSPDNRARFALPFDFAPYDPMRCGRRWHAYLREVFAPDDDADAKIELLQQFVGACLMGQATRYQRAMMLTGDGANGKSVFLSIIAQLFPPEARKAIPPQDLGDDNKGAELATARINIVGEVPDKRILSGDTFKAIVAGDEVTRRLVYSRAITFRPECGHIFSANALPLGADASPGFWRRWLVVPFNRVFTTAEQDPFLTERIIAEEMPAVAAWAVAGAQSLARSKGYTIPPSSEAIRDEWRISSNPVEQFVAQECERGQWQVAKYVYGRYHEWARGSGYVPMNVMNFGIRLREMGVSKRHTRAGVEYDIDVKNSAGGAGNSPI